MYRLCDEGSHSVEMPLYTNLMQNNFTLIFIKIVLYCNWIIFEIRFNQVNKHEASVGYCSGHHAQTTTKRTRTRKTQSVKQGTRKYFVPQLSYTGSVFGNYAILYFSVFAKCTGVIHRISLCADHNIFLKSRAFAQTSLLTSGYAWIMDAWGCVTAGGLFFLIYHCVHWIKKRASHWT